MEESSFLCSNCNSGGTERDFTSCFNSAGGDPGESFLEAIGEIFGVGLELGRFVDTIQEKKDIPYLCQSCVQILTICVSFKAQFLSRSSSNGTLGLILINSCDPNFQNGADENVPKPQVSMAVDDHDQPDHRDHDQHISFSEEFCENQNRDCGTFELSEGSTRNDVAKLGLKECTGLIRKLPYTYDEYIVIDSKIETGPDSIYIEDSKVILKEDERDNQDDLSSVTNTFPSSSELDNSLGESEPMNICEEDEALASEPGPNSAVKAKMFQCRQCYKSFPFLANLLTHIQAFHTNRGKLTYPCSKCSFVSKSQAGLLYHMFEHTNEVRFTCPKDNCEFGAAHKYQIHKHVRNDHVKVDQINTLTTGQPKLRQRFKCTKCIKVFPLEMLRDLHSKRHKHTNTRVSNKTKKKRLLKLNPEVSTFTVKSEVSTDLVQVPEDDNTNPKQFSDQGNCSTSVLAKPIFDMYARIKDKDCWFRCPKCYETFAFSAELMSHDVVHHVNNSMNDPTFICPESECNFQSKFKFEFTTHMFQHSQETQFKCLKEECPFRSFDALAMRVHCLTHFQRKVPDSSPSDGQSITCEVCGKLTSNALLYAQHIKSHLRPHICLYCGDAFSNERCLNLHLQKMHGKKFGLIKKLKRKTQSVQTANAETSSYDVTNSSSRGN